ncbi:MAG: PTS sugar transporter subunit IIA [Thermoguttaceae bacterium]|nr:PTS sugar transporter subunit IIA [Thermoguttaceae bacterium]
MKFADFMCNESLNASLQATTKEGAIREMVDALVKAGQIPEENYDDIVHNVLKREELGSTGIGRCVAVPHTKFNIKKMVGTVAISPNGVDFDSLDGQPVRVLFMLISPNDQPHEHLGALEHIAKQLREDTFRRFMMQAKNQADIIELLSEADANQFTA